MNQNRFTFDEGMRAYAIPAAITFFISAVFYLVTRLALAFAGGSTGLAYLYAAAVGWTCWKIIAVGGPLFDDPADGRPPLFPPLRYATVSFGCGIAVM